MNKTVLVIAVSALLGLPALAEQKANDTSKSKAPPKTTAKAKPKTKAQQGEVYTGSYIKQDVRRNGHITDGPNPLYVIDSKAIKNSGASTVRDLLMRGGFNR